MSMPRWQASSQAVGGRSDFSFFLPRPPRFPSAEWPFRRGEGEREGEREGEVDGERCLRFLCFFSDRFRRCLSFLCPLLLRAGGGEGEGILRGECGRGLSERLLSESVDRSEASELRLGGSSFPLPWDMTGANGGEMESARRNVGICCAIACLRVKWLH